MEQRTYSFQPDWLEKKIEFEGKVIQLKKIFEKINDDKVKCVVCNNKEISFQSKGYAALTQHVGVKGHKDNMRAKLNDRQQRLNFIVEPVQSTNSGPQTMATKPQPATELQTAAASANAPQTITKLQLITPKVETTKAELLLLLNGLSNNCSLNSFDNLGNVLKYAISYNNDPLFFCILEHSLC